MARSRGWAGELPRSDQEARNRILDATRAVVIEYGQAATLSHVAAAIGVTRQTVYRYFSSTEELLRAHGQRESADILSWLDAQTGGIEDPVAAILEALALTIERVPEEPFIAAVFATGRASTFESITSPMAVEFGRSMLVRFDPIFHDLGKPEDEVLGLVEWILRVLSSMLLDPGTPVRRGSALREFLGAWLRPSLSEFFGSR